MKIEIKSVLTAEGGGRGIELYLNGKKVHAVRNLLAGSRKNEDEVFMDHVSRFHDLLKKEFYSSDFE